MLSRIKSSYVGLAALAVVVVSSQASAQTAACPGNPNALGVSRTVAIDTTGGPGFGFEHFKDHDFLKPGEIVLTFDDGPWPHTTAAVLAALASHCTKATFFSIGKHATWHPEILKQVAEQGHTIGSHTWSHPRDLSKMTADQAKTEFEMGVSAVRRAVGDAGSSFVRFPSLKHPPELVKYVGERNIAMFSTDIDSFDFKLRSPEKLVSSVMERIEKKGGKGILLMHDFQQATAKAVPDLLAQLKAKGYKIVHMKAKAPAKALPQFDEMVAAQFKGPTTASTRPTSSVVTTIEPVAPPPPVAKR